MTGLKCSKCGGEDIEIRPELNNDTHIIMDVTIFNDWCVCKRCGWRWMR